MSEYSKQQPVDLIIGEVNKRKQICKLPPGTIAPDIPVTVPLKKPAATNSRPVSATCESSPGSTAGFLSKAGELADIAGPRAPYIPFMSYWPTYDAMSTAQKNWYFYWRDQVRKGKCPDTGLSYIFIYTYELINLVGVRVPQEGFEKLLSLWTSYRKRYPRLDYYLVAWLLDYIIVYNLDIDPIIILQNLDEKSRYFFISPDFLLEIYSEKHPLSLPFPLIELLSDYDIRKSRFFDDINSKTLMAYIPKVLARVDKQLHKCCQAGILQLNRPDSIQSIKRLPFEGAIYNTAANSLISLDIYPYSSYKPLRSFVTSVVKRVENKFRELAGFKGRLKGCELSADISGLIDSYIYREYNQVINPPIKPKITVDQVRIKLLIKESDHVRDLLASGLEESTVPMEQAADTTDNAKSDIPGDELQTGDNMADGSLTPCTYEMFSVTDDCRQSHSKAPDLKASAFVSGDPYALTETGNSDLPGEWLNFIETLNYHLVKALKIILTGRDAEFLLPAVADESLMLPEMLIDTINEHALETIGDIVIEPGSIPPVICEPYFNILKKVLRLNI